MKYYNFECDGRTSKQLKQVEHFKQALQDKNIKFEISGNFDKVHFEILLNENQVAVINKIIDKIFYNDCITEQ